MPSSFPTAVTANTGIPYFSASLTNFPKFTIVWYSYFEPTKIDIATALAFRRIASSIETVMSSWDKSSPIIVDPPDTRKTIGVSEVGDTDVLWTPRVTIKESQYFRIGAITFLGFSNFSVGPRK